MKFISPYMIKSFKHDGHLHRTWLQNWFVSPESLLPHHRQESYMVLVNDRTPIIEANGKEWTSRIPGVSFFIPHMWFNIVALLEQSGIRYYCNIASPPYVIDHVVTYIDYDLDVIRSSDGHVSIVDQDEYDRHKTSYQYPLIIEEKVQQGLDTLLKRIETGASPFHDHDVHYYYEHWLRGG